MTDALLYFLKLGGSLITDKTQPHTERPQVLKRLAKEIRMGLDNHPGLQLVLGHGSGSFGHVPGKKYRTRQGVTTPAEWVGFVEVWVEAIHLNRLVMDALWEEHLPAVSLPPIASVTAQDGRVKAWDLTPIQAALEAGLIPVIFGDVVFDLSRGGTILSTEDLFVFLSQHLRPERVLLAGLEPGVWADYPACTRLIEVIHSHNLNESARAVGASAWTDVTGGMASKVQQSLEMANAVKNLHVSIFSGEEVGNVRLALEGKDLGTLVRGV
jgi:isopentenyl phosphate kinase